MEITFEGPTFFAQEDENRFFEWIYSLPAYQRITGKGLELTLNLKDPVDQDTIEQLLIIFRRWNIDIIPLKNNDNESFILWA